MERRAFFVWGRVTYTQYRELRARIDDGFIAELNGRTAYNETGLRIIAKAEGFDPDAAPQDDAPTPSEPTAPPAPKADDEGEDDGEKQGAATPTPADAPAEGQTGQETDPGANAAPSFLTASGLDAMGVPLKGLNKHQLQEIGTFLGMADVDAKNAELIEAIEVLRAAAQAGSEGVAALKAAVEAA